MLLDGYMATADVSVNPRYGRWDPLSGSVVALDDVSDASPSSGSGRAAHDARHRRDRCAAIERITVASCARPVTRAPTSFPTRPRSTTSTRRPTASTTSTPRSSRRLVAAAAEHGEVLYAVPGSPLVLERSVRLAARRRSGALRRAAGDVVPRRRVGPARHRPGRGGGATRRRARVRPSPRPVTTGPLLITHTHADWVLSDIKLAVEDATGDEPVVDPAGPRYRRRADHRARRGASSIARSSADHLTCVYVPAPRRPRRRRLRALPRARPHAARAVPVGPRADPRSLMPYLVEETFELVDALEALDPDDPATDEALIEELGDLLYQIEFHATIAEQEGRFSIVDVTDGIHDKLVRRHPHVFGDVDVADVRRGARQLGPDQAGREGRARRCSTACPTSLPALASPPSTDAQAAGSASTGPTSTGPLAKVDEELDELRVARVGDDEAAVADELGDVLFAVVNVARHLDVDAELALRAAAGKFRRRFEAVEALAAGRDIDLRAADLADARRALGRGEGGARRMKLQLADPADHPDVGLLPFSTDLEDWTIPDIHPVVGLHRHVVRLVEVGVGRRRASYVVKELPDHLVLREYRMLRGLAEDRLPTAVVVAAVTGRTDHRDGLLVTRHLDYALPYRSLLSGRGLHIPYLGDRLLDALVGLLVRLHLAGFFWGDCSLSNTLFRRDAGALSGLRHRHRDVRALPQPLRRTAGVRPADRHRERRRRAARPAGRRAPRRRHRPVGHRRADRDELRGPVARAQGVGGVQRRRDLARRGATRAAPHARLRRRRDGHRRRRGDPPRAARPAGGRERLPPGPPGRRSPGCGRARTRPDACSSTSATSAPSCAALTGANPPENVVAVRWLDQRFEPTISADPAVSCAASCRTPRSTTSTSSTVG